MLLIGTCTVHVLIVYDLFPTFPCYCCYIKECINIKLFTDDKTKVIIVFKVKVIATVPMMCYRTCIDLY